MFYVTIKFLCICKKKNKNKKTHFFFLTYAADFPWLWKITHLNKAFCNKAFLQKKKKEKPQINIHFPFPRLKKLSSINLPYILHFTNVFLFFSLLVFLWQIFHSRQILDLQYRMLLKETLLSDAHIKSNKLYPASCWQLHFFPNAYFSLAWPSAIWQVCPVGKFIINSLQLEIQ